MALTFWQRIRVALHVWAKRREQRNEEFLRRNAGWGSGVAATARTGESVRSGPAIDLEGLQAAYLDRSGRIAYFLDVESGEVVENAAGDQARYRRVPSQTAESEAADRTEFAKGRRGDLGRADATTFRAILATDRALERAWYSFKNERATLAIESWLRSQGLR
jgi:hypothetical protein